MAMAVFEALVVLGRAIQEWRSQEITSQSVSITRATPWAAL